MEKEQKPSLLMIPALRYLKTKLKEIEKQEKKLNELKLEKDLLERQAVESMKEHGITKLETHSDTYSVEDKYTGSMKTVLQSIQQDLSDAEMQRYLDVLRKHNCLDILKESVVAVLKGLDDNEKKTFKEAVLEVEKKTGIKTTVRYDVHWSTLITVLKELLNNDDLSTEAKEEIMEVFNVNIQPTIKIKNK